MLVSDEVLIEFGAAFNPGSCRYYGSNGSLLLHSLRPVASHGLRDRDHVTLASRTNLEICDSVIMID
jgi:hypothetical protein